MVFSFQHPAMLVGITFDTTEAPPTSNLSLSRYIIYRLYLQVAGQIDSIYDLLKDF